MKKFLFVLSIVVGSVGLSQTTVIMNAASNNTTVNACLGGLFDSGGAGPAAPYQNNENFTVTICPDVPGDLVSLYWVIFQLNTTDNIPGPGSDADNITIWDGPDNTAPTLGTYTGNQLNGSIVSATNMNPSGCLTIQFVSNANGVGNFNASITCDTPCDPPIVDAEILNADNVTGDSIAVCVGEVVDFQDAGTIPGDPIFTLVDWTWDFGDGATATGTSASHAFTAPGEYTVQLYVEDDNGCINNNLVSLQVLVATYPTFDPFPGDTSICLGETLVLSAQPDQYEVEWTGFPGGIYDEDNCVGDNVGVLETLPLQMTGFGATVIDDISDIVSICVDIEHSFMGDFVLQIQCPTGQIMTLHQQGGGGTNLGVPSYTGPVWNNTTMECQPAHYGTPWNYCFTPSAPLTWIAAPTVGGTLPVGDYAPIDPFSDLFGCELNGTWQLLFTDLWGGDDGYLPGFQVNLDPSLYPAITTFTPDIGSGSDSSSWDMSDPWIVNNTPDGNTITVEPGAAGSFSYTYSVMNNFGCAHDSTITITVTDNPSGLAGPDFSFCNTAGTPVQLGGSGTGGSMSCTYTLDLVDTFGDSWNGNTINVFINGVSTNYTVPSGSGSTYSINVNHGDVIGLQWIASGSWQSECEIYFYDADGNLIHTNGLGGTVPSTALNNFTADCFGGLVFEWTPNDGSLDNVNIPNPNVINPAVSATYTLSVYPVGHPDCVTLDDVTICIVEVIDAGVDGVATFCASSSPQDLFGYLGGTPQPGGSWFDASWNPVPSPFDPSANPAGVYAYIKDSLCCADTAYVDVTIITLLGSTDVIDSDCQACNGSITLSSSNGTAPLQFSNDGGLTFQASDVFTNLCGGVAPGTNYSFVIEDATGCQVTVDDNVLDINFPVLDAPVVVNASCHTVCDGQITLTGSNIDSYTLIDGLGVSTTNTTGVFTNLCLGTYSVEVDNGHGCTASNTATITEPTALQITSLTPDFNICDGGNATLNVTGTGGNGVYTYTWTTGATNLGVGSSLNINVPATMTVCVTMSENCPSPTVQQCLTITVPPLANPMMTSDVVSGCKPLMVNFTNLTNYANAATTLWQFSNGGSTTVNGNGSTAYTFSEPGLYDVSMIVTSVEGCVYDTTFVEYIEVFDHPTALFTFNPNPATVFETEVSFEDHSSDDVEIWNWTFDGNATPSSSTEQNPKVYYPEFVPGDYPVYLEVWNANNCKDSIPGVVHILNDVALFAPNIFTPDGDSKNQTWRVYIQGVDIYDFHLTMFNRWGEVVWESYNIEGEWNGRYGSQSTVQDGTYVWVIEAKDSYSDKKYEFRGHVTILK